MRRARKILLWVGAVAVGLPVALILAVLLAANTGAGQRLIAGQVGGLSGGLVEVRALSGRFPDALRVGRLAVRDARGDWLVAEGVALDWSPLALLGGTARIDRLAASRLVLARLPEAAPGAPKPAASGAGHLPVGVEVRALAVARAELGAPVAGVAATLALEGAGRANGAFSAGDARVSARRLDGDGRYDLVAALAPAGMSGRLTATEAAGGLIASLAKLPGLGAIAIDGTVAGPRAAERLSLTASAGALRLAATGTADLGARTAVADVALTAPAMRPRPDIAWQSLEARAHVAGPWARPAGTLHLAARDLAAAGVRIGAVEGDGTASAEAADLHLTFTRPVLPLPKPELFAAAPVEATLHAALAATPRAVTAHVAHPLLDLLAEATLGREVAARATLVLPDLAPFAALGGTTATGRARLTGTATQAAGRTRITLEGTGDITGGQAPLAAALGRTTLSLAATVAGEDVTLETARLQGQAVRLAATARKAGQAVTADATLTATDLAALAPQAVGAVEAVVAARGTLPRLALTAQVTGRAGSRAFGAAPVRLDLAARNLPAAPEGTATGTVRLRDADGVLDAAAETRAGGALHLTVRRADWKSLTTRADLTRMGEAAPTGTLDLRVGRLEEVGALIGQSLAGALTARLESGRDAARVTVQGRGLAAGARRIGLLDLTGRATGIDATPDLNAVLTLGGIDADGVTGGMRVTAAGRPAALGIQAEAALETPDPAAARARVPARLSLAGVLDAPARAGTLRTLTAGWKTLALRLRGPARIEAGTRIAVRDLALALNDALVSVDGTLSPALDARASVTGVSAELLRPVLPTLRAAGRLTAEARLRGTPQAPTGTARLSATGLHLAAGPAASLPPGSIEANATLGGATARIDLRADAGPKLHLSVTGTAPLRPDGVLALAGGGRLDLALLNPILEAEGRRVTGIAAFDLAASGTAAAPRATGAVTLTGGEVRDYAQGLRLQNIAGRIEAAGDTFRIARLSAGAGPGTISISGSVGALAPGLPVDLAVTARNARPVSSDLLTTTLSADLTLRGQAAGAMTAAGTVRLGRTDINVPNGLPPSVAVLNVRRPGDAPPGRPGPVAAPPAEVALDLMVDAPSAIFVRGHGLDAELGGRLRVGGTARAPQIGGGFELRRGTFSLAGAALTFTHGAVGFDGVTARGAIDPTLDFTAESTSGGVTAQLKVTGYADAPKFALTSTPELPQDEVLAHLLFGVSVKDLSPFQIAEIAAAVAELSGVTGSGGPLASLRKGLGLDRLSVGGGANGAGPTVEAGRYVAKGVYVGAKQSTGGAGGTQAQVQIDLTRRLKLQTTLGAGGGTAQGATPENDPGTSIGLSYGFEY